MSSDKSLEEVRHARLVACPGKAQGLSLRCNMTAAMHPARNITRQVYMCQQAESVRCEWSVQPPGTVALHAYAW
jgi:hypothetical protein